MRAEISIMKSLHHENIVQLLDAITVRCVRVCACVCVCAPLIPGLQGVDRYMYIMLEYCDGAHSPHFPLFFSGEFRRAPLPWP